MSIHHFSNNNAVKNCPIGKKIKVFIENHDKNKLEGILGVGSEDIGAPILLLLHPQPNSNGNMWNEVLQKVMNFALSLGFVVLTINFSGVGNSTGKLEQVDHDAFQDAATAFKWITAQRPYAKSRWVFGFSFGAYIAAQLTMRRPEIDHFIYMSMPIGVYDLSFFSPCPVTGLMIHAINDKIVLESNLVDFILKNDKCRHVNYIRSENTNHFFKNVSYESQIFPYIYKFMKENCNWSSFMINHDYENCLDSLNYLQYSELEALLKTLPIPIVQEQTINTVDDLEEVC